MLVLDGGTLIDGIGRPPRHNAVVMIDGGRITGVGRQGALAHPAGARVIDTRGKTIMPGLIDAHVHDLGDWAMGAYLRWGITTVKDAGSTLETALAQKQQVDSGGKKGPRLFVIGPILDGSPVSYPGLSLELRDPYDAHDKVTRLVTENAVDGLLIAQQVDAAVLRAVVRAAHAHNLHVSGQTWVLSGKEAVLAGINALENTSRLAESTLADDSALTTFTEPLDIGRRINRLARIWNSADWDKLAELIGLMVERGVCWIPTLVMFRQLAAMRDPTHDTADIPAPYVERWQHDSRFASWDGAAFDQVRLMLDNIQSFTRRFYEAGGTVIAGTDNPNPYVVPGLSLHQELELLVEAGLPPQAAITSATGHAAGFLSGPGQDAEFGVVAAGKLADLMVIDGDPLRDIRHTRRVSLVIKGGQVVAPET